MPCKICEIRRPRRSCPAVGGEICAPCCGEARENTLDCPSGCEYLIEARLHEKPREMDPDKFPHKEIAVTQEMIRNQAELLLEIGRALIRAASMFKFVDGDIRDALEAVIRTRLTEASGLIYETRPENPAAARLSHALQIAIEGYREKERERLGITKIRDTDVIAMLAFLQRLEIDRNNGRPRGRAFLDFLSHQFGADLHPLPEDDDPSRLIIL